MPRGDSGRSQTERDGRVDLAAGRKRTVGAPLERKGPVAPAQTMGSTKGKTGDRRGEKCDPPSRLGQARVQVGLKRLRDRSIRLESQRKRPDLAVQEE